MSLALSLDRATGKLHSSDPETLITYNDPWPCPASNPGVTGAMDGVVLHTMDGWLAGTIALFNQVDSQGRSTAPGSAHFGLEGRRIHQFVPVGQGHATWHAFSANQRWYGVETSDGGHPERPIPDVTLTRWAQVFEFLSRFAGFPLQVAADCHGKGLAYHRQGDDCGWNRNRHSCPGASYSDVTRVNQRAEIVHRAHLIRDPAPAPPAEPFAWTADGHTTGRQLAQRSGVHFDDCAYWTAMRSPDGFGHLAGPYIRAGRFDDPVPAGTRIWVGKHP